MQCQVIEKTKAKKYEKCICKKYFFKNQRCKYNHCLVNLQYTPPPLHIPKEWNILFRFLELLPTALGCCVVCELLLTVIIELRYVVIELLDVACSFVSFFYIFFQVMFLEWNVIMYVYWTRDVVTEQFAFIRLIKKTELLWCVAKICVKVGIC